jgi:hypothetical protein
MEPILPDLAESSRRPLAKAIAQAVVAAYGWDDYTPAMPDEAIPRRLLALNRARSGR